MQTNSRADRDIFEQITPFQKEEIDRITEYKFYSKREARGKKIAKKRNKIVFVASKIPGVGSGILFSLWGGWRREVGEKIRRPFEGIPPVDSNWCTPRSC